MTSHRTIREMVSFSLVGIAATLTHIAVAWAAYTGAAMNSILANLAGASSAFLVSFIGNAALTFSTPTPVWRSGPRYLTVSFASFLIATGIMKFVESTDLSIYIYAIAVLVIIPPTTFLLAKFWVFGGGHTLLANAGDKTP